MIRVEIDASSKVCFFCTKRTPQLWTLMYMGRDEGWHGLCEQCTLDLQAVAIRTLTVPQGERARA